MKNISREDIRIISRHSNIDEEAIDRILHESIYNDKAAWQKFLQLFFISLGVGFTASGIVFFFAYNWADLHKFAKLGLVELLIIASTLLVLLLKTNTNVKNIILTGSAVLVGVLFAVFGQIYQTGANAYDFFLGWTVFVTLWVIVSNFAPLWLIYLILINTTYILYSQQVARELSQVSVFTLLFIFNAIVHIGSIVISQYSFNIPQWFLKVVGLAAVSYATIGVTMGILYEDHSALPALILTAIVIYGLGFWHGLKTKSGFYLAVIPFSVIVIIVAFLIKVLLTDWMLMFFVVSFFIIASVTVVVKNLIDLQKKWADEK